MLLRTIVLNHHSLSQPWEVNRGAFYVAKASVKLVIFLPVHAGFATPGCIPVLTWWLGGWRKSRNESFCFCVFPVLRGACLYCLCAYHSLCYTWTLWSPWPWTDGMVLTQNEFGRNLLFQLCIMSLICSFLVYLITTFLIPHFSFRRAMFEFSAVHYSLFQFPTYLPIFLVLSC